MAIYKIKGAIQHYAWGGNTFIPSLLKIENSKNQNFAEYWLGTHALGPAIEASGGQTVAELIQPGKLSYLLKILDVKDMLSIQVHPTKKSAEEMFAEENRKGIPPDAPNRNYKDDNHKPELVVALGEFWLLHGFKKEHDLKETLLSRPELNFLLDAFQNADYQNLYREVMSMHQLKVNETLQPLLDRIVPLYDKNQLKKNTPDFWAARAAKTYNTPGRIDPGIFSIYFFNLVELKKGQGVFQDAGVPHAYLEGQNVEIMSNSDNVLRGGLTMKHIDVPELMKHVKFEAVDPVILNPVETNGGELVYQTPVDDFRLSCFRLRTGERSGFSTDSADIILQIEGKISLQESNAEINLSGGEAAVLLPGSVVELISLQDSLVFRATGRKN